MLMPLGISFIVALMASTITALTLTPVLCSFLLGSAHWNARLSREPRVTVWLRNAYSRALAWSVAHRRVLFTTVAVLFVAAVAMFFTLGRSFLPGFNEGSFTINVSTLPGVSLDESNKIGRVAEELLLTVPEIKTEARRTGRAELEEHTLGTNVSEIDAPYVLDGRSRGEVATEIRQKLSQIPGVNVEIGQPISHRLDHMLSGTQAMIAIKVFGDDLNKLYALGKKIKTQISTVDGVVDVNIEQQVERPELAIRPRRQIMARYGVTPSALRTAIETALNGAEVSQVYEDGFPFDVTVVLDPAARNTIDDVSALLVDSNRGKIPLSTIADVVSTTGPNTINRENVKRRIVVSANVEGRDMHGAVNDIRNRLEQNVKLPENYYITYGGQFESEEAASRTLAWASACALLIILMLLYYEYHNWSQCLIILLNMPLAMIGGVIMLCATGGELNIPAIIGFISLLGITTRNGMLLISRFNALKDDGVSLRKRVMEGASDRLLPIVMTALTSALALIPLALNGDAPGNEIQSPMAIVILGGLLSATVLNIFVVPAVYYVINRKNEKNNE